MITTDMILKSLNLAKIEVIINYDLPQNPDDYFVRLRHVDEIGEAVSLVSKDEKTALEMIELIMKQEMPKEKFKDFIPTPKPQSTQPKQNPKDKKKRPLRVKS